MAIASATVAPDAVHLWERRARPAVNAILSAGEPVRAVIIGNAGSGKSALMREIRRRLAADGRETSILNESTDLSRVPPTHVLFVDDAHLLSATQIERVRARAEDADAEIVVSRRAWPHTDAVDAVTRLLERSRPAIVLGHVSRSDVLTLLQETNRQVDDACLEDILDHTGGISWLVAESLALHDERDCSGDRSHRAMIRAVEERIAHRLDTIAPALRVEVVRLCISAPSLLGAASQNPETIAHGYSEGLLMRSGRPVPLVRSAVRATTPATSDSAYLGWTGGIADIELGRDIVKEADRLLEHDPARAAELFTVAREMGIDPLELAGRQAQAAWAVGEPALASSILDGIPVAVAVADGDRVADTSAAIWSARGLMRMSDTVYRSSPVRSPETHARALVAGVGVGRREASSTPQAASGLPSTLGVALELLERGLQASLTADGVEAAVADLVRASELYTSAATSAPIPELPAVIGAIVALNVGDLEIAHEVIEAAIAGDQGGEWARTRLLLWRAWIAVQRARPAEARTALNAAVSLSSMRSSRDALLAQAIRVAIVRRYEDAASLDATWAIARESVLHTEVDLYMALPLAELVTASARVDDPARLEPLFAKALQITETLGSPAVWSTHLHWAGIQRGIFLNRPDMLEPHARALVAATPHSPIAAVMAQAGRVWTATLAGSVDPDAVEAAAHGLSSAGLGWDGARLAGHGANRSTDRKVSARLLSCARELHPQEVERRAPRADDEAQSAPATGPEGFALSERERDVARLVLQGKTYAEIGETIFISPRTAEHHIAHIRRRIGATSRSDLIAKLRVVVEQSSPRGDRSPANEGLDERTP